MRKSDITPILEDIREIRFGVETYINLYYQAHGKKIKYTLLNGLSHPTKYEKTTPAKATKEFISEGKEIAITYLDNYNLITKRIKNSMDSQSTKMRSSIKGLQEDINKRIKNII